MNKTNETIDANKSVQLTVNFVPSNVTNKKITWSSSNTNVAIVDNNGNVTGKNAGVATITATSPLGIRASCVVTVKSTEVLVESLAINKTSSTIRVKDSLQLSVTVNPSNATNKNVTWSSSNTNIATVSSTGIVKGISKGTAIITGKTNNGKIATCKVTVNENNSVTYINTSAKLTRSTAKELYISPTLKYWVENNDSYSKYGIAGFKVFHIWVEDPYNQFKTALSNGNTYSSTGTSANNIFSKYVQKEGKGFVGTNGSFYVINNSPSEWASTPRTAFIVYNGKIIRNDTNVAKANFNKYKSYNDVAGITQNGELAYYEVRNGYTDDRSIEYINKNIKRVVDDKVKYTVASLPKLVTNGKAVATSTSYKADRMFICQVDKNNFIMGYVSSATESGLANFLANDMKCKTAVNIDGGGSCGMYYKGTGGVVNEKNNGRKIADVVYFAEK